MASIVKKGWILTGVYCAVTLTPGVSAMAGFFVAWGVMMILMPAMMLAQFALFKLTGAAPDWLSITLAALVLFLLIPLPTLVQAWRTAPPRQRGAAVTQIALMWIISAGATAFAMQSLEKAWRY